MSAKQAVAGWRTWIFLAGLVLAAVETATAESSAPATPPIDPFDYSYCGGQPVYPVIGYNFATFCGPRNQVALGRRGNLMWLFPAADGRTARHQGARQLSEEELKRLSLLAEVAQLADPTTVNGGPVIYDLGIDFQGRSYKRIHTTFTDAYTSANKLVRAMLALVPDQPLLPGCAEAEKDFNPTLPPAERRTAVTPGAYVAR
jgi:hypothetical protein